mgnify:CR=1 FL=1
MSKNPNQKLKLLYLKELFERQSDEEHLLSMQDILDALAAQGIGKTRERRARCRQQEVVIAPHSLQRDGEERRLREELAHLLDERRRLQTIALGFRDGTPLPLVMESSPC